MIQFIIGKMIVNYDCIIVLIYNEYLKFVFLIPYFSIRKSEKILKISLESIIVPMFCSAMMRANEDQKSKLSKVK